MGRQYLGDLDFWWPSFFLRHVGPVAITTLGSETSPQSTQLEVESTTSAHQSSTTEASGTTDTKTTDLVSTDTKTTGLTDATTTELTPTDIKTTGPASTEATTTAGPVSTEASGTTETKTTDSISTDATTTTTSTTSPPLTQTGRQFGLEEVGRNESTEFDLLPTLSRHFLWFLVLLQQMFSRRHRQT